MKEYDDQIRIDKFNPFFEDDEVINPLDDGFFNNPFDTIQTIPDFDLINMVIQDPYTDGFIPPSTDPFTELGCDKTGVLGKIGYDDEIKKTDEREGYLTDYVTNNPILVVQAGETADFTLIENNQSPDKYNWIVKESGTVIPRMGQRVTLTAPDSVPDGDEAIKLYLFNKQHQLDYVKIEIESSAPKLFISISKEGCASYGFVWDVTEGIINTAIGKNVTAKGKVTGKELFQAEESSRNATSAYGEWNAGNMTCTTNGALDCHLYEPASCPGIDNESLTNHWWYSTLYYPPFTTTEEVTLHNAQEHFNSYELTALNDSDYIGAAKTYLYYQRLSQIKPGVVFEFDLIIKTPIGEIIPSVVYGDSSGLLSDTGKSNILGQFTDKCISQCYIYQSAYYNEDYERKVYVLAQAAIVEDGNTQTPRGLERTTDLETAVEALVNAWYAGNGFGSTDIETLTVTWELRQ